MEVEACLDFLRFVEQHAGARFESAASKDSDVALGGSMFGTAPLVVP